MMFFRQVAAALAGLVFAGAVAGDALAQRRDRDDDRQQRRDRDDDDWRRGHRAEWELLGRKRVGFGVDRDVIQVEQSEDWYRNRRFRSLHFQAQRNDIHMMSIRLVYLNGFGEDFRVDRLIRDGEELPIELRGERSFIRRIEMTYRSRPGFGGDAVIRVFAEPSRRGGPPPGPPPGLMPGPGPSAWVELGCKEVSLFGKDRDAVVVGRREGRFKAIRLHVRGADVEILDLKVVYANGQPDDIQVRNHVRRGERTRPLDLKGRERSIDRVELVYRTALNPADIIIKQRIGQANVCVEGLQ